MSAAIGLLALALALWDPARSAPSAAQRLRTAESPARGAADRTRRGTADRTRRGTSSTGARPREPQPPRGASRRPLAAAVLAGIVVIVVTGPSPIGVAAGLMISVLTMVGARRFAAGALRRQDGLDAADLPLFLDVVATQLRAGAPIARALHRASPLAPASAADALIEVTAMLRLGAPPDAAWRAAADTPLADLAALARRSADNGAQLADQAVRLAADLRADRVSMMEAAARRAGVWAMAPLGLCFLPAFVCLGVGPVVMGLVGAALGDGAMPGAP